MSLTLHSHPFASFCQKVLIAFYEHDVPFTPHLVDFGDPAATAAFKALWPVGKMPVLVDTAKGRTVMESSIVIEYLDRNYPGSRPLIPADPDLALEVRFWDRFFDLHVQDPMQRIVGDRIRPADRRDAYGVETARASLATGLGVVEGRMTGRTWACGETFSLADCAAAPALFYANWVAPFGDTHPNVAAYLERLMARPSFARVAEEAKPYHHLFPQA